MNYYFISDFHLGHFNIIKYCNRPFATLQEMDSAIINNFNNKVKENDTCFFLGDFCFSKSTEASSAPSKPFDYYRKQLNCKNIIFISGNHDSNNGCKSIIENITIHYGGKRIFMVHNPKFAKEDMLNFCGHVHEKWRFKRIGKTGIIINLSVEQWNYFPVSINQIFHALTSWIKNDQN